MLYNIKIDIAYIVEKQYLCSRIINPLIITIMTKKLTKNVSISQGVEDTDERVIVNYTKPFKKKPYFVVISHNITSGIYEVRGISAFETHIQRVCLDYLEALEIFYYELCWMINTRVMLETSIQRHDPAEEYLNK